jgi:hypothetical protein
MAVDLSVPFVGYPFPRGFALTRECYSRTSICPSNSVITCIWGLAMAQCPDRHVQRVRNINKVHGFRHSHLVPQLGRESITRARRRQRHCLTCRKVYLILHLASCVLRPASAHQSDLLGRPKRTQNIAGDSLLGLYMTTAYSHLQ